MRKRFLGIIGLIYSIFIIYLLISKKINYFLAPKLQIYIKVSIIPFLITSIITIIKGNKHYKMKKSDILLLMPIIIFMNVGDGRFNSTLANNRINNYTKSKSMDKVDDIIISDEELKKYNFNNPFFNVVDESYDILGNYITFEPSAKKFENKSIKVRGMLIKNNSYLPNGYFFIGKYSISCCAADANYVGFIVRHSLDKLKENNWYEVKGILKRGKDKEGYDVMYIYAVEIEEIDPKVENQYVYPCYSYDDGECKELDKYDL